MTYSSKPKTKDQQVAKSLSKKSIHVQRPSCLQFCKNKKIKSEKNAINSKIILIFVITEKQSEKKTKNAILNVWAYEPDLDSRNCFIESLGKYILLLRGLQNLSQIIKNPIKKIK